MAWFRKMCSLGKNRKGDRGGGVKSSEKGEATPSVGDVWSRESEAALGGGGAGETSLKVGDGRVGRVERRAGKRSETSSSAGEKGETSLKVGDGSVGRVEGRAGKSSETSSSAGEKGETTLNVGVVGEKSEMLLNVGEKGETLLNVGDTDVGRIEGHADKKGEMLNAGEERVEGEPSVGGVREEGTASGMGDDHSLVATETGRRECSDVSEGRLTDSDFVRMELMLIGHDRKGRIHTAVVSGVNADNRSVTVEWFEKGETKGKEIEMDAIFALNKDLGPKSASNNNQSVIPTKVTRYTTHPKLNNVPPGKAAPTYRTRQQVRGTMIPPSNGHDSQARGDIVVQTPARGLENIAPTPPTPTASAAGVSALARQTQLAQLQLQKQQQLQQQQILFEQQQKIQAAEAAAAAAAAASQGAGRGRRSNVVKEVERLKKNREERRQRQAELKEEKEVLMSVDPGNPNWEFLNMIREFQQTLEYRPLRDTDPVEDHQITVCIRKRPLNKKELMRKEVDVITVASKDQLIVHEPKLKVDLKKYLENQQFRFDYAFDDTCSNELVYKYTAQPLVRTIFEGGMATCFAYGQTGSGKTHTMGGVFHGKVQDCKNGIYAMAAKDVFQYLKSPRFKPMNFVVSSSFFEIYSGKVFDLLANKNKLRVLEDGKQQVQVVGLTEKVVDSVDDVLRLIQHGNSARTSGQTSANSNSSRSHAVFQIIVRTPGINKVHGKFSLIDLAGNERGADTSSSNRQTRMEGAEINKSLLALKECIRALGRKGAHLPFRASKLTQVLRDSFIGDKSRTCMIAMVSPGLSSCDHSLNTLRYADRVKELAANDLAASNSPSDEEKDLDINESDLAQLRSLNEGEISAEMFTFHEAVSCLQNLEDEVLDAHKFVMEKAAEWQEIDEDLINSTRDVDYDQDSYSTEVENLVTEKINTLTEFREKLMKFRAQLVAEEQISQKIKRPALNRNN